MTTEITRKTKQFQRYQAIGGTKFTLDDFKESSYDINKNRIALVRQINRYNLSQLKRQLKLGDKQ